MRLHLLILNVYWDQKELVAVRHGDLLSFEGDVISIISPQRKTVLLS